MGRRSFTALILLYVVVTGMSLYWLYDDHTFKGEVRQAIQKQCK